MWGYLTFATEDNSRNLWWASILTYEEGWLNNHMPIPMSLGPDGNGGKLMSPGGWFGYYKP